MHLESKTTIKDILNYKKTDIQSYLKSKGKKNKRHEAWTGEKSVRNKQGWRCKY